MENLITVKVKYDNNFNPLLELCILDYDFSKYLAFGMIFQILIQAAMNLMVVIGLIPVTGVTLPFLSYGGSSLLISMISVGILLNISRNE